MRYAPIKLETLGMFNRLAAVQIKAAQDAADGGRYEEALHILAGADLADHRRARRLREEIGRHLFDRGQERVLGKRFLDAIADFQLAGKCGVGSDAINEWRLRAEKAMQDEARDRGAQQAAVAEANRKLAEGSLLGAREALAKAPSQDAAGGQLMEQIKRQGQRALEAVEAASAALKQDQLPLAAEHLRKARGLHSNAEGLAELETKLVGLVLCRFQEAFGDGRLDRAAQELSVLGQLGRSQPDRLEAEESLRLAREAARLASEDRYAKATVLLGRLAQLNSSAPWIEQERRRLNELESHRRGLMEGPLGSALGSLVTSAVEISAPAGEDTGPQPIVAPGPPPIIVPRRGAQAAAMRGPLAKRLLLRIDGVGTYLLLRGDRISIGRSGPGSTADVDLISDLAERHADIVRASEDYFVVSTAGVELAGRPVDHALLQDGDRIRLGSRVKLKFGKPSLKSPTAFLDLADGVRMTNDCRRVILWCGPLLLGGTRECHVPICATNDVNVLLEKDGRFILRRMGMNGPSTALSLGMQVEFGNLRLSLQEANNSGVGQFIG